MKLTPRYAKMKETQMLAGAQKWNRCILSHFSGAQKIKCAIIKNAKNKGAIFKGTKNKGAQSLMGIRKFLCSGLLYLGWYFSL